MSFRWSGDAGNELLMLCRSNVYRDGFRARGAAGRSSFFRNHYAPVSRQNSERSGSHSEVCGDIHGAWHVCATACMALRGCLIGKGDRKDVKAIPWALLGLC